MKKLSKPLTELKFKYDVIVVGSGYGGSIAASRMSRCGRKVCLMEKGKEFLPGQFPKTLGEASREMQFNKGKVKAGSNNGLYEFTVGSEISVFKGCGLGGTSLVNANVSIKPDPRVLTDPCWPTALRNEPQSFEEGLEKAWGMLKPTPYPENKNGYPVLKKTEAMRKSAEFMSEEFRLLDINVNFEDKEQNHVGVKQPKCNNCGDCVTGCNRGAKNTTAMNYLPDAFNHGAEIFTNIEVSYIERSHGLWRVYFYPLNSGREKFDAPPLFIHADQIILSAGSLGSTEILLRSAEKGLKISGMLGKGFTGNGDVLGFGYNNDVPIHGIGLGNRSNGEIANVGPCITSVIDMRNRTNLEDGLTLEEGTVPGPISSLMASSLVTFSRLMGKDSDRGFKDYFQEKWREVQSLFRGPYHGAVDHTQIYLVMSHDDGNGEMELKEDKLNIHWKDVGRQNIFKKVSGELASATTALGGNIVPNPTWNKVLDYDLVTVHPLGGCIMADDASKGVVDHKGQVFNGTEGKELYPGLFVMDGAIIPRPVGTNPLLTISALAERSCKIIAQDMGLSLSYSFNPVIDGPEPIEEEAVGVQFTETMKGFLSLDKKEDYDSAYEKGKQQGSAFEFTLTILSEDVGLLVEISEHQARMTGTMKAPFLSDSPLT
ncbi:MAG: GMC family oxidoreductase, partial [Anditalea sp.]